MTTTTGPADRYLSAILIGSIVLLGISLRSGMSIAVLAATVILAVGVSRARGSRVPDLSPGRLELLLLLAIAAFAVATILGAAPKGIGPTSTALETLPSLIWLTFGVFVYSRRPDVVATMRRLVVVVIVAFAGLVGVLHIQATGGVGLDVLFLHKQAAAAIAHGVNPYTDAVSVPNGSPTAEPGDTIDGYVYPPITALAYSLGEWAFSDPRYTSLLAWLVVLSLVGAHAVRHRGKAPLLVLLLLAAMPGVPLTLRAAWTEPLSLALAAGAFYAWRRQRASGALTGLTLASKQYFVVAAPIVALARGPGWKRRLLWTAVAVVVAVGIALPFGVSDFWSSAVAFHLSTPPRPDSLNLVGLFADLGIDVDLPSFLPLLGGLAVAWLYGRSAIRRTDYFVAMALSLAVSFLFSSQAFANYWFLVAGICGLVLTDAIVGEPQADPDTGGSADG